MGRPGSEGDAKTCSACGKTLEPSVRFCGACGLAVATDLHAREVGTRHVVSILLGVAVLAGLLFAWLLVWRDMGVTTAPIDVDGGTVELAGGGQIIFPPGSVRGKGTVVSRIAEETDYPAIPEEGEPLAHPIEVELIDAELVGEATIELPVDATQLEELGEDRVVFAARADADSGWQGIDTEIDTERNVAVATVDQFSFFAPMWTGLDFNWEFFWALTGDDPVIQVFAEALGSPRPPNCDASEPEGFNYEILGDGLLVCREESGDIQQVRLKVVNARNYPVVLTLPDGVSGRQADTRDMRTRLWDGIFETIVADFRGTLLGQSYSDARSLYLGPTSEVHIDVTFDGDEPDDWIKHIEADLTFVTMVLDTTLSAVLVLKGIGDTDEGDEYAEIASDYVTCAVSTVSRLDPDELTLSNFAHVVWDCTRTLMSEITEESWQIPWWIGLNPLELWRQQIVGTGQLFFDGAGAGYASQVTVTWDGVGQEVSLEMVGGTWRSRDVEHRNIGVAFVYDPQDGDIESVDVREVSGGWNDGETHTCRRYQPPGISPARSLCWVDVSPDIPGLLTAPQQYQARTEIGSQALETSFEFSVAPGLEPPQITSTALGRDAVDVQWTASPGTESVLVRVGRMPWQGEAEAEIVMSGGSGNTTLAGLDLSPEFAYEVTVWAFSHDVTTEDPLVEAFNIASDSVSGRPEPNEPTEAVVLRFDGLGVIGFTAEWGSSPGVSQDQVVGEVSAVLGAPSRTERYSYDSDEGDEIEDVSWGNDLTITFEQGSFVEWVVYSNRFATEAGLRVGDSGDDVRQLYPEATFVPSERMFHVVSDTGWLCGHLDGGQITQLLSGPRCVAG